MHLETKQSEVKLQLLCAAYKVCWFSQWVWLEQSNQVHQLLSLVDLVAPGHAALLKEG